MNELSAANSKLLADVTVMNYVAGELGDLPSESMWEAATKAHKELSEALTAFMEQAQRALNEGEPRRSLPSLRRRS